MSDEHTTDSNGLTRRQALAAAAALCGFGAAALAGTGTAQASGTLRVTLSQFPELRRVGGIALVGSLNGVPIAVARTGSSSYVALDRRCPHQGVAVSAQTGGFICRPPGHGSQFDLDGDKVSGITPRGLRRLRSRLSKGVLTITG